MLKKFSFMLASFALAGCSVAPQPARADAFQTMRCVNMGNALEAPREGDWGHRIDLANFARIRAAGFDTVRLPLRWSGHLRPGNVIDPVFRARVDEVLEAALAADLNIVLNIHHFEDLMVEPEAHYDTFLDIWKQLADHYQDLPARVSFEVLNEPSRELKGDIMRRAQKDAIAIIRQNNPTRTLILGGENWSNVDTLRTNYLSPDRNVVYTFHYYDPFDFTHQKAPWLGSDAPRRERKWGSAEDYQDVRKHMAYAKEFSDRVGRKVFLGEFGAFEAAPESSRRAYMSAVSREAEAAGLGWCVWSFTTSFPLFDDRTKTWLPGQLEALGLSAP